MFNSFNISGPIPNYFDDLSPDSTLLEELPYFSSYYHLPSPLIYNEIDNFGEFFLGHHELAIIQQGGLEDNSSLVIGDSSVFGGTTSNRDSNNGTVLEDGDNNNITRLGVSPGSRRRKSSRTDRHSKISTANGLRDRRMRLSLKVARPFFKLQDMLGYDKASKTIEWLLIQSKSAIEERFQSKNGSSSSRVTHSTVSSISDYEVESIVIEEQNSKGGKSKGKKGSTCIAKDINKPKGKRTTTKESRREARDRARKRTLERMQSKWLKNDEKLPICSTLGGFEIVEGYNDSNSQIYRGNNPIEIGDHVVGGPLTTTWSPFTLDHFP